MGLYAEAPQQGDPENAKRQLAWKAEWLRQFAALPPELQAAMNKNELHPAFDNLFESVKKAIDQPR
jgi:hypothetical protein